MAIADLRLDIELHNRIPFGKWEIVDVKFPGTANVDLKIVHTLEPADPYDVHYMVMRQTLAGSVYEVDPYVTATVQEWTSDYIVLRSSVASQKCRLLLTVLKTPEPFIPSLL